MTIIDERLHHLPTLTRGAHSAIDDGACLLEAVAWVAGEKFSDHPLCVCPVLASFGRAWNDALDDETRNRLLPPFIPRLVGTRSTPDVRDARAFMAADWAVRIYTPVWLRAAGLDAEADALEALPVLSSVERCRSAMPAIGQAKSKASAAGAAAGDAAGAAAGAVAAASAARSVARSAAGDAAWTAAWTAAGATAAATAGATAVAAIRAAAGAVDGAAAGGALKPHVELLQTSAVDLFDRMIRCEVAA